MLKWKTHNVILLLFENACVGIQNESDLWCVSCVSYSVTGLEVSVTSLTLFFSASVSPSIATVGTVCYKKGRIET